MKMITRTLNAMQIKYLNNQELVDASSYVSDMLKGRQQRGSQLLTYSSTAYLFLLLSLTSAVFVTVNCAQVAGVAAVAGSGVVSDVAASAAPPPSLPHAAALASPGGSSSSILQQFSPNCSAVSHIFQARGIAPADIPSKPSNEMGLRYCESPAVGTCCTYNMETKMAMQSKLQLEKHSKDQIIKMSSLLETKARKFNEIFRNLLLKSKEEFHIMFTKTYGVIYQQNSYVFSDLFNELENYYARGRVDLMEVMDKFFNTLYQKMFQVLNAQYSFDENYLRCVSEHMKELKPFGDMHDKLSVQIKRSFVATRTYGQSLATAAEVAKKLANIRHSSDCTAALTKMQHCGACKGYAEKPCTNYCVNVIKGCLAYFSELDGEWENFVMAMDKVAERLLGSFNIVMVVEPINIKISEAIMNFQDKREDITSRVFQGCGRPTLGRARRAVSPKFVAPPSTNSLLLHQQETDTKVIRKRATVQHHQQPQHQQYHTLSIDQIESDILDIDAKLDDAIVLREKRAAEPGLRIMDSDDSSEQHTSPRSNNGGSSIVSGNNNGGGGGSGGGGGNNRRNQRRKQQQNRKNDDDYRGSDPILDKLVRDIRQRVKESKKFWSNLPHQICSNDEISTSSDVDGMCWNGHTIDRYMHSITTEPNRNPEFPGNPATTRQTSQVATQLFYLKNSISHLRNAYNGQDVDWSDQEEPYYGSGAGSGGGIDDEDDDEGSGLGGPPFVPTRKPEHPDHGRENNVDDEDGEDVDEREDGTIVTHTTRPKFTPGSTGVSVGTGPSSTGGSAGHETNVLGETNHSSEEHHEPEDEENEIDSDETKSSAAKPEKMSLRRALLLYLLPLYMAWFGGICAELL